QAAAELVRELDRLLGREATDPAQQRAEVLAVDVLHRQERANARPAEIVHAADVRMRHTPRELHLFAQAREMIGIVLQLERQELQRDRLIELEIAGEHDLAHPTLAER